MERCRREHCRGSLYRVREDTACKECAEVGATSCEGCWVEIEWRCTLCSRGYLLPRMRRRDARAKGLIT